jgi:osmotically inducible lipoprotein OsmB
MIKQLLAIALVVAGTVGITGCATRAQTVGTAGGAVAGGALGSAVTGGSTIGTVGGAAAGGILGNEVGKDYNKKHP